MDEHPQYQNINSNKLPTKIHLPSFSFALHDIGLAPDFCYGGGARLSEWLVHCLAGWIARVASQWLPAIMIIIHVLA
jgi:hypothetical protein